MRTLRILFMGTPEFATTILKGILDDEYNVVGVVTAPDKPAGRGRKLHQSHVKTFAVENGLEILQPTNLKADDFQESLERLNPNVIIVVAFRMLPEKVWRFPKYGTFNLHASLLPQYRGAAPIHWAIINGETETGVTTFFIDDKIDTGEIILQEKATIEIDDTVGDLHDRLMHLGTGTVIKTLELIKEDKAIPSPQPKSKDFKTAYKLNAENTRVDWERPIEDIYNHVRGLNPFPVAYTMIQNGDEELRAKLYSVKLLQENHSYDLGKLVIKDNELYIAGHGGYLVIEEMQLPNKKRMAVKDLLNGFTFDADAYAF